MRVRLAAPIVFVLCLVLVLAWAMTVQAAQLGPDQSTPEAQASDPLAIQPTLSPSRTLSYATFLPMVGTVAPPVYWDDFSNPASGWYVGANGNVRWAYRSGGYEIRLATRGWWGAEDAPWNGRVNYVVASDMQQLPGNGVAYGLIFGFRDWDHFYVLIVNPADQEYTIMKRAAAWVTLVPWTQSNSIQQGTLPNRLRIERRGSGINAYINGQLQRTLTDSAYTGVTKVGIYAASGTAAPATARFDNFGVWALGSTAGDAGNEQFLEPMEVSPGMAGPDAPQP